MNRNAQLSMPPSLPPERMAFYQAELVELHAALEEHPITRELLDGDGIAANGTNLTPEDTIRLDLFDQQVDIVTRDFAQLFSVFSHSRVNIQRDNRWGKDDAPPGLYVTVINPNVIEAGHKNKSGLFKEAGGDTGLAITALFVDRFMLRRDGRPQLLGTIAFCLCALQAYVLGLQKIELLAAGGAGFRKQYVGYWVWPKLGFDARLEPGEFDQTAPPLANCATVLEAMAASPDAWKTHGSQRLMAFDLAPNSTSWLTLLEYTRSKGLWSTPS